MITLLSGLRFSVKVWLLSAAALIATASAASLPEESRTPGGIAIIPLEGTDMNKRPNAWYRSHRVMVTPTQGTYLQNKAPWAAVIGLPLNIKPADSQHMVANGKDYYFSVEPKEYKAQYLTIKNKNHVNPDPAQVERWKVEKAEMTAAFTAWRDANPITEFILPAKGRFSSPFGLKRFYNNQARNPHSGLDIAAPQGDPIWAPAPGVVTAVGNYFFNGNTVILDHGNGLTTMYCHMSKINVKVGDKVNTLDNLGLIGKTGRVTGPHLHWSVSLNNTRVDPLLFVKEH